MNERLLHFVEDAGVHLGDNLSRHSPIMMKLNMGDIPIKQIQKSNPKPRRPDWYKATDENLTEYTALLDSKLQKYFKSIQIH